MCYFLIKGQVVVVELAVVEFGGVVFSVSFGQRCARHYPLMVHCADSRVAVWTEGTKWKIR